MPEPPCNEDEDCGSSKCVDGCCKRGTGAIATFNTALNEINVADLANDNVYTHSVNDINYVTTTATTSGTTGTTRFVDSYDTVDGLVNNSILIGGKTKLQRISGINKVDVVDMFF